MEMTPWLHPAFLTSLAVTLIGLAAWFIRLESKANSNSVEIERIKKELSAALVEAKTERRQIEEDLYKHLMDTRLHYNEQFFNEFRNTLENRFKQLENQLAGISSKIDHLTEK